MELQTYENPLRHVSKKLGISRNLKSHVEMSRNGLIKKSRKDHIEKSSNYIENSPYRKVTKLCHKVSCSKLWYSCVVESKSNISISLNFDFHIVKSQWLMSLSQSSRVANSQILYREVYMSTSQMLCIDKSSNCIEKSYTIVCTWKAYRQS